MFSPMAKILFFTSASTVFSVPSNGRASRASTFAGFPERIVRRMPATNSRKVALLATKSVSELTSTMAVVRPSALLRMSTTPSAAMRSLFFAATASPFSRRIFIALSKSPSASTSAFLHSIIPMPVFLRSSITSFAAIFAIMVNPFVLKFGGESCPYASLTFSASAAETASLFSEESVICSPCLPSMTASAITEESSLMARMASSLPGMT